MKHDPTDRKPDATRQLEDFFRDEARLALADAPSFEDLVAYVEDSLPPEARALLEERLAGDEVLRAEVEDLRALRAAMAPRRRAAWPPMKIAPWMGLAAVFALLAFWLAFPGSPARPPATPPASPAAVAALKDGDLRLALASDGSVAGLPAADAHTRAVVGDALRGTLPAPQGLEPLRPAAGTLMGTAPPAAFVPRSPLGVRVGADRPLFRWTARPGARTYEVAVFDQDLRRRLGSGPVTGLEWTPARPLERGRVYLWQVTALDGGPRLTAPAPPAPEARFEVAAPAVMDQVARARAVAPGSHLVAALALVEAGLLDEAEGELRALAAENPAAPEVARLQALLAALSTPRAR